MKPIGYYVAKQITKQYAVWGLFRTCHAPLIYLQRPKWIKDNKIWDEMVKSLTIKINADLDIK